ncbi:MAG: Uncharacterised protein [Hyphomonas sp. TMED17]|nr:MAG: Uncharacterised protein [Hyphomonas sp. TMED17]
MAGIAFHFVIIVREVGLFEPFAPDQTIFRCAGAAHQFRSRGPLIIMRVVGVDAIFDKRHFPFKFGIHDRALDQNATAFALNPFEPELAVWIPQQTEVFPAGSCRRATRKQSWILGGRAVAIPAAYFNRAGHFAMNEPIAVTVLLEVAVCTLHAFLGMDRH